MGTAPPAVLVKNIVSAHCTYLRISQVFKLDALFPAAVVVIAADGQFEQCRRKIVACLAPIKPGMRHQDNIATNGKRQET